MHKAVHYAQLSHLRPRCIGDQCFTRNIQSQVGGSPGLVVIGGYSGSEGCGFESQHHILNGHFHINLLQKL